MSNFEEESSLLDNIILNGVGANLFLFAIHDIWLGKKETL